MKIFNTLQSKELYKKTLSNKYISSLKLIEKAAAKTVEALVDRHKLYHSNFVVLCGDTNNGAVGMAMAKMLIEAGGFVKVFLLQSKKYSPDNISNQTTLANLGVKVEKFSPSKHSIILKNHDIIIDAIYGQGLQKALEPVWSEFFAKLTKGPALDRISIEMPSGMFADKSTDATWPVFTANMVYTYQNPKLALLFPKSAVYAKDFTLVDLGLDSQTQAELSTNEYYITRLWVKNRLEPVLKFADKQSLGHALLVGGSKAQMGKSILASKAALKAGLGELTCYIPQCGYIPLLSNVASVNCLTDANQDIISGFPAVKGYNAIGIGSGLLSDPLTVQAVSSAMSQLDKKTSLVVESHGVDYICSNPELLTQLPVNTILILTSSQLEALIGEWVDEFEKLEKVRKLSKTHELIFVLPQAHTQIVLPKDQVFFNSNYNCAFAGSQQILMGLILGYLTTGYSPKNAAIIGVYLHGKAFELAKTHLSSYGLQASDLLDYINLAISEILKD